MGDIAFAINRHAQKNGYSVVEEIGGHGIGLEFHEDPFVCYVAPKGSEMVLVPGMMFTIEPMINVKGSAVVVRPDGTVLTKSGSLSAHFEHTVAITASGPVILTR